MSYLSDNAEENSFLTYYNSKYGESEENILNLAEYLICLAN